MSRPRAARSGVRPLAAFALLAGVLAAVAARLSSIAEAEPSPARAAVVARDAYKEPPRYAVLDREGRPLARSVRRYALEASPFNLWLVHTPENLRDALGGALGLDAAESEALLDRALAAGDGGKLRVARWPLAEPEAFAVADWLADGRPGAPELGFLPGLWLEACAPDAAERARLGLPEGPCYELWCRPRVLLARATREAFLPELAQNRKNPATTWVAELARGLFPLLEGPRLREARAERAARGIDDPPRFWVVEPPGRGGGLAARLVDALGAESLLVARDRVERVGPGPGEDPNAPSWAFAGTEREWLLDGLVPRRYAVLVDPLPADALLDVRDVLLAESVSENEVWLQETSDRVYPAGRLGVVGRWSASAGLPRAEEGLERLAAVELEALAQALDADGVGLLEGRTAAYVRRVLNPRSPGRKRGYFLERGEAVEPAALETTLDLALQRFAGLELDAALERSEAALAMAVVVDLATREVLALDWRERYPSWTFAPLQHQFVPGSTFKCVTMSIALEEGLVRPDEVFDVGDGVAYRVRANADGTGSARVIGEAEGAPAGRLTAAGCLARSSNAGMVQIGLRVPCETWRDYTARLGYGAPACGELLAPGLSNPAGAIGEVRERNVRWKRLRSHASVSFGDSIALNLLQHARGIAALVSDGRARPLGFARAIRVDDLRVTLPPKDGERIVSEATVETVRAMLRLGALEGTGAQVERPEGLWLATKTGTTEKLVNDVCLHALGRAREAARERARSTGGELVWDENRERARLHGQRLGRNSCYVSSIAAVGRSADGSRELLALVVIDDPHASGRPFGSRHAGPVAVALLAEALGFTRGGRGAVPVEASLPEGLFEDVELPLRPWAAGMDAELAAAAAGGRTQ